MLHVELLVFHNRKLSVKAKADVTGLEGVKSTVILKILAENNLSLLFIEYIVFTGSI